MGSGVEGCLSLMKKVLPFHARYVSVRPLLHVLPCPTVCPSRLIAQVPLHLPGQPRTGWHAGGRWCAHLLLLLMLFLAGCGAGTLPMACTALASTCSALPMPLACSA